MKIEQRTASQIELTLVSEARPARRASVRPYRQRRQRALWWFREMHRVVDGALGLSPNSATRGEQRPLILVSGS